MALKQHSLFVAGGHGGGPAGAGLRSWGRLQEADCIQGVSGWGGLLQGDLFSSAWEVTATMRGMGCCMPWRMRSLSPAGGPTAGSKWAMML